MSTRAATLSWLVRIGMALGVVFDMTLKPEAVGSIAAVAAGVLVGIAVGLFAQREVRAA